MKTYYLIALGQAFCLTQNQIAEAVSSNQFVKWAQDVTGENNLGELDYVIALATDPADALRLAALYDNDIIQADNKQTPYGIIVCLQ